MASTDDAAAATTGDVLAELPSWVSIAVAGQDAAGFLQGQLTCDVRRLSDERSLPAAACNAEGRVIACLRLCRRGDVHCLFMPAAGAAELVANLRRYVLRARVAIDDRTVGRLLLGLSGPGAPAALRVLLGGAPLAPDGVLHAAGATVLALPGLHPRYLLAAPEGGAAALRETLATTARPVGPAVWDLLDIRAGLPSLSPVHRGAFLPQMLNLDLSGAVSFEKGCYVGQEVIAALQDRGRLARRLHRAHLPGGAPPRPGDPVIAHSAAGAPGREAGQVVMAAPAPEGGQELLAVLRVADVEAGGGAARLTLAGDPGRTLRLLPLPPEAG